MITKNTIDQIFDTARIEEVVGDFVALKKRGVNLLGLCPFHNEKTPSFTVSPAKGIYKCFGCGAGGGSVNFVMEHEKYSYPEALKYLAKKYNIEIEEEEKSEEQIEQQSERESQFLVAGFAQEHFSDNLLNQEEGKAIGLSYFKERGFTKETIEKFQLGYGMESWDAFTKAALDKGYQLEYLEKTGLTIVKDDRNFDRFRGRVIFPIHNFSGKVLGFGGRILKKDVKAAKYVNSPESDIYEKRKVLYGMYYSKKAIIVQDNCYLVEGYTDVISFHQAGIENVVAASGTSLTEDQIRLIKRITPNITILFDGDAAGIKASFRSIDLILQEGMNVRVVLFPEGEDPDSFAKQVSEEELKKFLTENSKDFISFKADLLLEEASGDPVKKAGIVKDIVASIAVMPDAIVRSMYLRECSKLMDIGEQILVNEMNKAKRAKSYGRPSSSNRSQQQNQYFPSSNQTKHSGQSGNSSKASKSDPQEKDLIRFLLNYGEMIIKVEVEAEEEGMEEEMDIAVAEFIVGELLADEIKFDNPVYQKVFDAFEKGADEGTLPNQQAFVHHPEREVSSLAVDLVFTPHNLSHNWEDRYQIHVQTEKNRLKKAVERSVYSLKMIKVKQLLFDNQQKIKEVIDDLDRDALLKQYQHLLEAKKAISKYLGRVVG